MKLTTQILKNIIIKKIILNQFLKLNMKML